MQWVLMGRNTIFRGHNFSGWRVVVVVHTEIIRSANWQLRCHWWHGKLLKWQLTVPSMVTKLSNRQCFVVIIHDCLSTVPDCCVSEKFSGKINLRTFKLMLDFHWYWCKTLLLVNALFSPKNNYLDPLSVWLVTNCLDLCVLMLNTQISLGGNELEKKILIHIWTLKVWKNKSLTSWWYLSSLQLIWFYTL